MIHMGSDAGVIGEVEIGVYSVSKAAVHILSNMLAIEAGRLGVRSNAIAPGDTEPGMRHMGPPGEPDRPEDDPGTWPVPPIGRIGRASDIAEAAVYLASDRAAFVNGVVLLLDGGMRAGYNTGAIVGTAKTARDFPFKPDQWNRFQVTAEGNHLVVMLNGETTLDISDAKFPEGHLRLQYQQFPMAFRNIKIRPLP